jgi:hypothetical protein
MRWDDAMDRMAERAAAASGQDERTGFVGAFGTPADLARKLLSGTIDGSELDAALEGLGAATDNTMISMALALQDERGADPRSSLFVALTQMLLLGLLVAGHPRGGGASQEPNDEFPGATQ